MPISPVSYSWKPFMWLFASTSSVVQVCPRGGTYCRSSSQTAHCAGGCALSGYCVPQAVQMKSDMDISKLQPKLIDLPGADDGGSIFVMAKLFPASVAHCHRSRDVCNVRKIGTSRLMVRSAPKERVSNHGPLGLAASFETPAFGGLLRMRSEVANGARAGLAFPSARPRESGDPALDSRLRGMSGICAAHQHLSDSIVKQP